MTQTNKMGVVISIQDETERKYVQLSTYLLEKKTAKGVGLNEATIFTAPNSVESTFRDYLLPDPRIEVVEITTKVIDVISNDADKYALFARMSLSIEEDMIND